MRTLLHVRVLVPQSAAVSNQVSWARSCFVRKLEAVFCICLHRYVFLWIVFAHCHPGVDVGSLVLGYLGSNCLGHGLPVSDPVGGSGRAGQGSSRLSTRAIRCVRR